jgi:hypothetical protein
MEEESEMMQNEGSPGGMDYGMDMEGYGEEMGDMMDDYGEEGSQQQSMGDDDSLNFEQDPQFAHLPPLDKMRKVRREVIKTCNDYRAKFGHQSVYTDTFTNLAANEYARFLLSEKHSEDALAQICEHHKVIGQQKAIIGFSYLDDDHDAGDLTKMNEFMDAHGLLLELQEEMAEIVNKEHTHIGIGFAADKHMVMIVELFSSRSILVNNLNHTEAGGIEVSGFNLKPTEAGLYAARIVNPANTRKDFGLVGPSGI